MAESEPVPSAPNKDVITAVLLCDRLYHGQFETVMSTARHKEFLEFLDLLRAERGEGGVAEAIIQVLVSETKEELSEPDHIHWAGIVFDCVVQERAIALECKGLVVPRDSRDVTDIEALRDMNCFTLSWQDIAWNQFDWTRDSHEQQPGSAG